MEVTDGPVSFFCGTLLSINIHSAEEAATYAEFTAGVGSRAIQDTASLHQPRRSASRFDLRCSSPLRKTDLPLRKAQRPRTRSANSPHTESERKDRCRIVSFSLGLAQGAVRNR